MEMTPPFVTVVGRYMEWVKIGASPWIVRQLRFGIQIPWIRKPKHTIRVPDYNLAPADAFFAKKEVERWLVHGLCRRAVGKEMQFIRTMSPAFVTVSTGKLPLVIDYLKVNECLEERSFWMEQLTNAAPFFR